MLSIPHRLLEADFTTVLYREGGLIAMEKVLDKDLEGRQNYLTHHVLSWVMAGEQRIDTYDGHFLDVKAGQMVLLQKGLYTINDAVAAGQGFRAFLVFFGDDWIREWEGLGLPSKKLSASPAHAWTFPVPAYAEGFWRSIQDLRTHYPSLPKQLIRSKIQEWFAVLFQEEAAVFQTLAMQQHGPQRSLREFMARNFDKPFSIRDYAYLTGRSESTFRREFKQRFGTTPRKWITRKRLEKAREMLSAAHQDIGNLAFEVGFENPSHFIQEFKRHFGDTPGQFQRQNFSSL